MPQSRCAERSCITSRWLRSSGLGTGSFDARADGARLVRGKSARRQPTTANVGQWPLGRSVAPDNFRIPLLRAWRRYAILVRSPATITGLIEVRGIGILQVDTLAVVSLALVVDLVAPQHIERLPEAGKETILGITLPAIKLAPFEASAPAKLRLALAALSGDGTIAPAHR